MIITKKDGTPFKTKNAAMSVASRRGLEGYEVLEQDGGYVVSYDDGAMEIDTATEKSQEIDDKLKSFEFSGDWKPAKLLDIPEQYKEEGYTYRWCDTSSEGNIVKKQSDGWEIDTKIFAMRNKLSISKSIIEKDFKENTQTVGRETRLRELILMRIPTPLYEAHRKYFREQANARAQEAQQLDPKLQGHTWGKKLNIA